MVYAGYFDKNHVENKKMEFLQDQWLPHELGVTSLLPSTDILQVKLKSTNESQSHQPPIQMLIRCSIRPRERPVRNRFSMNLGIHLSSI